jgi:cyclophilin family peptidyl-prolyl cis-trans isomerase
MLTKISFLGVMCAVMMMTTSIGADGQKNPVVKLETSMGDVFIEVYRDKAPISAKNFLDYVDDGYYDGTIFHRVIPGFMNQCGGFLPGLEQKNTKDPIKNEATNGLSNLRGTVAMARTSVVDSATSQFFFNTVDNLFLNHRGESPAEYGYAVFGKVIDGLSVVDKISKVKTHWVGYHGDVPEKDVLIIKASIVK